MEVTIFCDGSILPPNPGGPGGFAAVMLKGITNQHRTVDKADIVQTYTDWETASTNQRMELWAALVGLKGAWDHDAKKVFLVSDSEYVLKGIETWMPGWIARGWTTSSGTPVSNQDLWKAIDQVIKKAGFELTCQHVKGHKGNPWNEYVDGLAKQMSMHAKKQLMAAKRES